MLICGFNELSRLGSASVTATGVCMPGWRDTLRIATHLYGRIWKRSSFSCGRAIPGNSTFPETGIPTSLWPNGPKAEPGTHCQAGSCTLPSVSTATNRGSPFHRNWQPNHTDNPSAWACTWLSVTSQSSPPRRIDLDLSWRTSPVQLQAASVVSQAPSGRPRRSAATFALVGMLATRPW